MDKSEQIEYGLFPVFAWIDQVAQKSLDVNVMLFGESKVGKSTLFNTILGVPLMGIRRAGRRYYELVDNETENLPKEGCS